MKRGSAAESASSNEADVEELEEIFFVLDTLESFLDQIDELKRTCELAFGLRGAVGVRFLIVQFASMLSIVS